MKKINDLFYFWQFDGYHLAVELLKDFDRDIVTYLGDFMADTVKDYEYVWKPYILVTNCLKNKRTRCVLEWNTYSIGLHMPSDEESDGTLYIELKALKYDDSHAPDMHFPGFIYLAIENLLTEGITNYFKERK